MAIGVETTSLGWQIQQLERQVSEWIEYISTSAFDKVLGSGLSLSNTVQDILLWIAWIIFSLTMGWLGLLLFRAARRYLIDFWASRVLKGAKIMASSGVVPVYSVDQWLKKARAFQLEGNYTEACRALYMGMLQLLSDRSLIPQQYSRTDGEYRYLVKNLAEKNLAEVEAYKVLLDTHEQLCFSDRLVSSEMFHICETAYSQISGEVN
jgi:hypothetical protein